MEAQLKSELDEIKKKLSLLMERQEHLEDALLSAEDEKALAEARQELKEGRTVKLSEVKKKLGL